MQPITIGKYRGMQQCATLSGAISILALDHRNNLRNAINPKAPETVTAAQMAAFKQQVTSALAPVCSAVLLDPEVGAAQCITSGALPGYSGLVTAVEATGYTGDPSARHSQILPGWSVAKAKKIGSSAIKLLVYYHPDSPTAGDVENLVKKTALDCAAEDIPFILETLSYSLDASVKKLPAQEHQRVVLETVRRLYFPGVDVMKVEFPIDVKTDPDESHWGAACAKLSGICPVPWILLSASVDIDTYIRQVTVACLQGASGIAAGRAVWMEAPGLKEPARTHFLERVARPRMARLTDLVSALGRPWTTFFTPPAPGEDWYKIYN